MIVLELKPEDILDDPSLAEPQSAYVYDHLKYFFSLQKELPAVRVMAEGDRIRILEGHPYLRVARDLGRERIRAVVDSKSDPRVVETLKRIRRVISASEWDTPPGLDFAWHVFYFEPPLDEILVAQFRALIENCYRTSTSKMIAAVGGTSIRNFYTDLALGRIAFERETPWADEAWTRNFITKCREFSQTARRIVTYQGRCWTQ